MKVIKTLSLLLAAVMLFSVCAGALAETIPARAVISGECGADLTWTLDTAAGTLTISGTGDMYDWNVGAYNAPWDTYYAPWYSYKESIVAVQINDGVTNIGNFAFYNCTALTSVSIPDGVTSIGDSAFSYCSLLASVTIPDSVTNIGDSAFQRCYSLTSVTIPDSVTSIGDSAFEYCISLASVTIPDSVTRIGDSAFCQCFALTSATIGAGVTSIGNRTFSQCSALTEIAVDPGNPNYSSVNGVLFNKDATVLIQYPAGNPRNEYAIPGSVTKIENYAFYNCSALASVSIPDSVTSIGNYAFNHCSSLASVTIGAGVTSIGNYMFIDCPALTEIAVDPGNPNYRSVNGVLFNKDTTALIQYPAGNPCSEYAIPDSVTSIGVWAFDRSSALTSVTIPDGVTSIGDAAFNKCTSLASAVFLGTPPASFGINVFYKCASGFTIYYTAAHASEWAPNGENTWNGYPIQMISPPVIPGDVDGDGAFTFTDISTLSLFLIGGGSFAEGVNADFNGDGIVNFSDIADMYIAQIG